MRKDELDITRSAPRDLSLEAVRGVASIAVFIWHFFTAFAPALIFQQGWILGTPFYALVHGTAAVDMFFVLSAFVLTRRYFEKADGHLLVVSAAKRWFRLVPLVLISVLLSWAMFAFGLYRYEQAAQLTGSSWLASCGGLWTPAVDGTFGDALWEGFIGAIVEGRTDYNSNLWTIHIEFVGSMIAFLFAWIVKKCRHSPWLLFVVTLLCGGAAALANQHYQAFIVGTLLAAHAPLFRKISGRVGLPLLMAGFLILGYRAPIGFYSFMIGLREVPHDPLFILFSMLGSSLIIVACSGWHRLNRGMQGPISLWLGRLSFPLYVVHIILICSLGAAVFSALVVTRADVLSGLIVTGLAVTTAALMLSVVLSVLDRWWVREINKIFGQRYHQLRRFFRARRMSVHRRLSA